MELKNKNEEKPLKYNIQKFLKKLPHEDFEMVNNTLPAILGITKRQWWGYKHIALEDRAFIPEDKQRVIAGFFGCTLDDLSNYKPQKITMREIRRIDRQMLSDELRLDK